MTQQVIGVGSAPNDGLGDPLRTAFIKANSNFTELYSGGLAGRAQRLVNNGTGLTGSAINVLGNDQILNINVSSVSPTYALPAASGRAGAPITFKDIGGNFALHPLTISATGSDKIDSTSTTSITLSNNGASLTLTPCNDGTTVNLWFIT